MRSAELIELWRGGRRESIHFGHAVICDRHGVVEAWGDPATVIYPRSSCKMMQALPLVESGAADRAGLTPRHLALACGSHSGADLHVSLVRDWLGALGMAEPDLRCGSHMPRDRDARYALIRADEAPCQFHNNCSGKHAGFLTLNRELRGGPDYVDPGHAVQRVVKAAFEEVTGEVSPGYGIDGCSAPNHACSLEALARAMAEFATPRTDGRGKAMTRLVEAMRSHSDLVAGEGRACTTLMRAMGGEVVVKTGAEGVFTAILPRQGFGIAIKILDGASRASEAALVAILVHLGVLDGRDPAVQDHLGRPLRNCRGYPAAQLRTARGFPA